MTDILNIVERFTMQIDGPPPGRDAWFLDYVLRSPKQAGKHLTAGWLAMNALKEVYREADDIKSCREWFGGMGAQALMAERLFNLRRHDVQEYSLDAVEHLYRVLPSTVDIHHKDAYDRSMFYAPADLQILDYGDLTAWKTRDDEPHRVLLDYVFGQQPKAVLLTDIACRYLHLHRERYETLLGEGTCHSYPSYLLALLTRIEGLYDYRLVVGYYDRWSTVMALVPSANVPDYGPLLETPDEPVGLEIL